MATSAFRSTSRRSTSTATTPTKSSKAPIWPRNAPLRRSRSVSAFSRTQMDISADYSNKMDNPLFWSGDSKLDDPTPKLAAEDAKLERFGSRVGGDDCRGRSVSRNGGPVGGRSLSSVGVGRRGRSVSKGRYVTSESEAELDSSISKNHRNKKDLDSWSGNGRKANGLDQTKSLRTLSNQSRLSGDLDDSASSLASRMEDDSTGSDVYNTVCSEVKRAISDIRSELEVAFQGSSTDATVNMNVADLSSDFNPDAVQLVLDIRNEYTKKLEQSQERARRLRADLAIEEQREEELSRILKEVLPEQQTANVQKPRPKKRVSLERKRMSKRLEEEAKAYFDECVSISTFDGSDFSSQEDPPISLVGGSVPFVDSVAVRPERTTVSDTFCPNSCLTKKVVLDNHNQLKHCHDAVGLHAGTGNMESASDKRRPSDPNTEQSRKSNLSENFSFQKDIKNYIRNFDKEFQGTVVSHPERAIHYDMDDYGTEASAEGLLFDRILYRSAIESGSMLLCGRAISSSCSPFAPAI